MGLLPARKMATLQNTYYGLYLESGQNESINSCCRVLEHGQNFSRGKGEVPSSTTERYIRCLSSVMEICTVVYRYLPYITPLAAKRNECALAF